MTGRYTALLVAAIVALVAAIAAVSSGDPLFDVQQASEPAVTLDGLDEYAIDGVFAEARLVLQVHHDLEYVGVARVCQLLDERPALLASDFLHRYRNATPDEVWYSITPDEVKRMALTEFGYACDHLVKA